MSALVEHRAFLTDILDRQSSRRKLIDPNHVFPPVPVLSHLSPAPVGSVEATKDNVVNYVPEEETIRNDYTEWYGVSGRVGADYILGAKDDEICEEYPALKKLMNLKSELVNTVSHPPLFLTLPSSESGPSTSAITAGLSPHRFDVILIHPHGSWDDIAALPIRQISADPGFVFLWVGQGDEEGLDRGRECFAKWGFRRAEDIVWVKTSEVSSKGNESSGAGAGAGSGGLLASQKEHCLMGIRGTVRRSTDTRFVHCNVDTDVMIWNDSGEADGPHYPPYLHTLIESFCLGTRRLQLFAPPSLSRRGWVTASTPTIDPSTFPDILPFDPTTYPALLPEKQEGRDVLPYHHEIDMLRPKSPQKGQRRPGSGPSAGQNTGFAGPTRGGRSGFRGGGRGGGGNVQPGFSNQQFQQQPGFPYPQMGMNMPMNMAMSMGMGYPMSPMSGEMMMAMQGIDLGAMGMGGMGMPFNGYNQMGQMGQMGQMDPQMAFMLAQQQQQQQQQFQNQQMYNVQPGGHQQMWDGQMYMHGTGQPGQPGQPGQDGAWQGGMQQQHQQWQ